MASLKSFLYGVAPILGVSPAALYERQRALVKLGLLKAAAGHGPGSGVPFTAQNFAALLVSLLAAEGLSQVDRSVVDLCEAQPEYTHHPGPVRRRWELIGKPTFLTDVARVLSGFKTTWRDPESGQDHYLGIRVSRAWRGQIIDSGPSQIAYYPSNGDRSRPARFISISAEIEQDMLGKLINFTHAALGQADTKENKK